MSIRNLLLAILLVFIVSNNAFAVGAFDGCEGYGCTTRHAYTTFEDTGIPADLPDIYIVTSLTYDAAKVDVSGTR